MRRKGDNPALIFAWLIGGFVVAMLILFAVFGGLLLGTLMVAATPFVLGFLVVEALFGKRPAYVGVAGPVEVTRVAPPEPTAVPVTATVVKAEGICPMGTRFKVGDIWVFNGKVEGARALCPTAERLLGYAAAQLKEGRLYEQEVRCVGSAHRVVFALQRHERQPAPALHR